MFRSVFLVGRHFFQAALRSTRSIQVGSSFLTFGLIIQEHQRQQRIVRNTTQPIQKAIVIESDAIYLNKQTYMEKLLGNKRENYVLIVFGQENDEDTRASIKTAKHVKHALRQAGIAMNVYVVSRPTLENVRQIANRILDFPVFEKEGDPKSVEVYFKTIHSTDYVYFKWRKESFFTSFKTNKFVKKIVRYESLFHSITISDESTEKQLAELLQRQYIRLDEPVIVKCSVTPGTSASASQKKLHAKDVKTFKKLCFFSAERKLIPLKSQFIILENKDIIKNLNLEDGKVYILRNDILQKLQSSTEVSLPQSNNQLNEQTSQQTRLVIDDSFLYLPNARNSSGINQKLQFFSNKFESLDQFKVNNLQLLKSIDALSREQGTASTGEELQEMKDQATFINFIMPRITYLRDSKFGNIGKLFKKITFAKEKRVLSLNLNASDKQKNHSRLLTLKKLHETYYKEFTFLLVDSDSQIVDLFPHLDVDQPSFSLFNFFNLDKSALTKVGKYYKHLIFPFEKFFLDDSDNLYEDFDKISRKIDSILIDDTVPRDYVINQTNMIPTISSTILDQLVQTATAPFIVQVLYEDYDCTMPSSSVDANSLARFTLNQFQLEKLKENKQTLGESPSNLFGIFRMSYLNQHEFLKRTSIHNDGLPLYLFIDPKFKRVVLSQSRESASKQVSRQELVNFLKVCSNQYNIKHSQLQQEYDNNSPMFPVSELQKTEQLFPQVEETLLQQLSVPEAEQNNQQEISSTEQDRQIKVDLEPITDNDEINNSQNQNLEVEQHTNEEDNISKSS